MKRYVVAITGASGVVYGVRLVRWFLHEGYEVHLVVSDPGQMVLREEMGIKVQDIATGCCEQGKNFFVYDNGDIEAPIASGSFRHQGMVICPCSMSTLAGVALGTSNNLIERAADVCLKEGFPLILVPRETPLNLNHLRNMVRAVEAGAKIIPAMPAFYHKPESIEDLVDFLVGKVLDCLGLAHQLFNRYRQ